MTDQPIQDAESVAPYILLPRADVEELIAWIDSIHVSYAGACRRVRDRLSVALIDGGCQ
jgi:hypothetical protein